jgi:four helix bundle protein
VEGRRKSQDFTDLVVWQKAHEFVLNVYRFSADFPKAEQYGLTSQLRRAAISVPANIAEGYKKRSKMDKMRLYNIAQGSLEECRYYLILSEDLGYGTTEKLKALATQVARLCTAYIEAIKSEKVEDGR